MFNCQRTAFAVAVSGTVVNAMKEVPETSKAACHCQ